jgi:hypothetical protein
MYAYKSSVKQSAVVLSSLFWVAMPVAAQEQTILRVANNGVDDALCGRPAKPCRSISAAIFNASEGDLILVGPGIYDASVESGDDTGCAFGVACIVDVNKRVTIRSRRGAAETLVHGRINDSLTAIPILISASGAVVGGLGHGFTVTGSLRHDGLAVFGASTTGVKVVGNVSSVNAGGFSVLGIGNFLIQNHAANIDGVGFDINGSHHVIRNNSATANGDGFDVSGAGHRLTDNVSNGNGSNGFAILGGQAHVLEYNSAIGNAAAGFLVWPGTTATIRFSNIFGNGDLATPTNCGVRNDSGQKITAINNYWGAPTGPGGPPADNAGPGSDCDAGVGSVTIYRPFERQPVSLP